MKAINHKETKVLKKVIKNWILFVTVNDIETNNVLNSLKPLSDYDEIMVAYDRYNTYYIGKFGAYNVVHVQSGMGAISNNGIIATVDSAFKMWHPRAIIMIGVAWGMNKSKQKIGDVLISERITQFDPEKRSNGKSIPRGKTLEAGSVLFNRFKGNMDWSFELEDGTLAKKHIGNLLSGEKLIDDKSFRDDLFIQYPEAIGGDMEGAGFAPITKTNNFYEWIIVKGICDWGYEKQVADKGLKQELAVKSAISLCNAVLCDQSVLEEILKKEKQNHSESTKLVRINAYKLFYFRNNARITMKKLSALSEISISKISKLEKLNYNENEHSIEIFKEIPLCELKKLASSLKIKDIELIALDKDFLGEKYKNYYFKRKGIHITPLKIKNARIVIFDFDGTLTSSGFSRTTWERIWVKLGYSVDDCAHYHQKFSNKEINHTKWCELTEAKFKEGNLTKEILKQISVEMSLIDGCKETLELLSQKDILLYIVSGSVKEVVKNVLGELFDLFEDISANKFYFRNGKLDKIIGTDFDFEGKAEYIKKIASQNNISPNEILFIGNSFNDKFAYLSGARTLCINPSNTNFTNTIYWHNYIREVHNLEQILKYVFIEDTSDKIIC